jgi:hypothetical protein
MLLALSLFCLGGSYGPRDIVNLASHAPGDHHSGRYQAFYQLTTPSAIYPHRIGIEDNIAALLLSNFSELKLTLSKGNAFRNLVDQRITAMNMGNCHVSSLPTKVTLLSALLLPSFFPSLIPSLPPRK